MAVIWTLKYWVLRILPISARVTREKTYIMQFQVSVSVPGFVVKL